ERCRKPHNEDDPSARRGDSLSGWSDICMQLAETWNDPKSDIGTRGHRGAVLLSSADKGLLQFQCVDDCFSKTTLSDSQGIQFPGANGRHLIGNPWMAWKTASIFIRKELSTMQKVEQVRNRAVSLDTEALRKVLMVAYSVCTEWTEFICTTMSIAKHESIDQNCVIDFYRIASEDLKKELQKDEREARSLKKGPTGFAAPEEALLMERDASKGGLTAKVVSTYKQLRNTLEDWTTFAIWVIVLPMENREDKKIICDVLGIAKSHSDN
ncbi:hypothetical protein V3C99_004751, partial [Haemonchus contortus]